MTPSPRNVTEQINKMFDEKRSNLFVQLYCRWQDEKQYEDIKDYQTVIQQNIPVNFKVQKMTKRPFGFHFKVNEFPEATYSISVNSKSMGWGRVE
jgi:hypothetical protein